MQSLRGADTHGHYRSIKGWTRGMTEAGARPSRRFPCVERVLCCGGRRVLVWRGRRFAARGDARRVPGQPDGVPVRASPVDSRASRVRGTACYVGGRGAVWPVRGDAGPEQSIPVAVRSAPLANQAAPRPEPAAQRATSSALRSLHGAFRGRHVPSSPGAPALRAMPSARLPDTAMCRRDRPRSRRRNTPRRLARAHRGRSGAPRVCVAPLHRRVTSRRGRCPSRRLRSSATRVRPRCASGGDVRSVPRRGRPAFGRSCGFGGLTRAALSAPRAVVDA